MKTLCAEQKQRRISLSDEMYKNMSNKISKAARKVISDERLLSKLDEFTDEEIALLCSYGRALHTTTDFDEEVERELEKLEAEKHRRVNPGSPFQFKEAT